MTHTDGSAVAKTLWLVVIAFTACNGRFDFDTEVDASLTELSDAKSDTATPVGDAPIDSAKPYIGKIECDRETCDSATQHCCLDATGPHCIDALAVCSRVTIRCDDPSDCLQGNGCCSEARSGQVVVVECEDATSCLSKGHVLLCSPSDPRACSGGICISTTQSPLPPAYHQCN
jgi:hypothetical protein